MSRIFAPVVVLLVVLSACVGEGETDVSEDRPSTLGEGAVDEAGLDTIDAHAAPSRAFGQPGATLSESCRGNLEPIIGSVKAVRVGLAAIDVELSGLTCGSELGRFGFSVLTEEDQDISGRSWPEEDAVEIMADGSFSLRAKAIGCGDYTRGERIEVFLWDGDMRSNVLEVDIAEPVHMAQGESCEAFGVACAKGLYCGVEGFCEAP